MIKTGISLTVMGICSTAAAAAERARAAVENSDIAWGCASKHMRAFIRSILLQVTLGIPIFVYTAMGLDLVYAYSDKWGADTLKGLDLGGQYLLSNSGTGPAIVLRKNRLRLTEADLPVSGRHEPKPLR